MVPIWDRTLAPLFAWTLKSELLSASPASNDCFERVCPTGFIPGLLLVSWQRPHHKHPVVECVASDWLVAPVCRWTSASGKTFERLPFRCTNKNGLGGGDEVNIRESPEQRVIRCLPTRLKALLLSGRSNLSPKGFAEASIVVPTDFQSQQTL
jgi:hypothetical protein